MISIHQMIQLLLFSLASELFTATSDVFSSQPCAKDDIPVNEERLREVALDTNDLMVNIVIVCVVSGEKLQWIKRQLISAMIIDRLDCGEGE